jgi:hypothetical protein
VPVKALAIQTQILLAQKIVLRARSNAVGIKFSINRLPKLRRDGGLTGGPPRSAQRKLNA